MLPGKAMVPSGVSVTSLLHDKPCVELSLEAPAGRFAAVGNFEIADCDAEIAVFKPFGTVMGAGCDCQSRTRVGLVRLFGLYVRFIAASSVWLGGFT